MARASRTAPLSAIARPLLSSTTTGLPVAATASARSCWACGRPMSLRERDSPDIFWLSPMASTTTSASRAAATAVSMPPGSGDSTFAPRVTVSREASVPSAARRPSSMPTGADWPGNRLQEPIRSFVPSAKGPISAIFCGPVFASGSSWPSFFSITMERRALSRASAMNSGFSTRCAAGGPSRPRIGSSKRPSLSLTRSTRRTASSSRAIGTSPEATRSGRWRMYRPLCMLTSVPAMKASLAASRPLAAWPCSMSSSSAV
ncbi:hypothetical protein D3C86_529030 [compost metagenome]